MSRFYADIQGNRGQATRQGSADSGIDGHIRGWDLGGAVDMFAEKDEDIIDIYLTKGSNQSSNRVKICRVRITNNKYNLDFLNTKKNIREFITRRR